MKIYDNWQIIGSGWVLFNSQVELLTITGTRIIPPRIRTKIRVGEAVRAPAGKTVEYTRH